MQYSYAMIARKEERENILVVAMPVELGAMGLLEFRLPDTWHTQARGGRRNKVTDALLQTHAFKTESAREHAIAKQAYNSALLTYYAAKARYDQACAMLTYLENIEYSLTEGQRE